MDFSELRAFAGRDHISFTDFDAAYTQLVNSGDWAEAVFLTSLMYLHAKRHPDTDTPDILALLKTTLDGCIGDVNNKKSQ